MIRSPLPGVSAASDGNDARDRIVLAHGGGGRLTDALLSETILPRLQAPPLGGLLDAGFLDATGRDRIAVTVDSYVVTPWRFPGGDIGRLAVSGTINDLAVSGARPRGLALSLILGEGFLRADLAEILDSIAATATEAATCVVTGDTKVVGRNQCDGVYITTAGVGCAPPEHRLGPHGIEPDDVILVSGSIGDHGLAIMLAREMPDVQGGVRSDAAPLNHLIEAIWTAAGDALVFMRDPTRAGLSGVAADLAQHSGWHVVLDEDAIPVRPEVEHASELLGLDPLEIANEGKVVVVVRPSAARAVLSAMRDDRLGRDAAIIGHVESARDGLCELRTAVGGRRIVQKPYGELLPRIC